MPFALLCGINIIDKHVAPPSTDCSELGGVDLLGMYSTLVTSTNINVSTKQLVIVWQVLPSWDIKLLSKACTFAHYITIITG